LLKIILLITLLFFYSTVYSKENLNNVDVSSLNILTNSEINNFVTNKLMSGFFVSGENFKESYFPNNNYLFEMLSGQNKGKYEGEWQINKNNICYLMRGTSNYDCSIIYWKKGNDGKYDIYYGNQQNVFAKLTQIEDLGNLSSNSTTTNQTQSAKGTGVTPEGTQNISEEDIVNINLNSYSITPSDPSLNQLNFNMTREKVVEVLKNNGCKIQANWKRRVITKGQKDSRDLKSKCFKKKMIVVGFEDNGVMEFIADTHYLGNDNKQHFIEDYDTNRSRVRIESFQRYAPNKIYNIGSKSAICLNKECLEMVYRNSSNKEIAFLFLNPKSKIGKDWAKKSIESYALAIERPAKACIRSADNPCIIFKAKYVDPSIQYLNMFMNGEKTLEREALRKMYINYVQAQILAAEALGLIEVASDLKLLLDYIVTDSGELDMEQVSVRIANGTNELYKNVNEGSDNEEAKKKIEEAHVFAMKAGNEGQLFFSSIAAIFSSGSLEGSIAATEVASRTKGNLSYFYKALREIKEAKNVKLTPETEERFDVAENSIEIE